MEPSLLPLLVLVLVLSTLLVLFPLLVLVLVLFPLLVAASLGNQGCC